MSEGNVMVGGKPVCDDNWGMEEVNKLDTHKPERISKPAGNSVCLKTKTKT